MVLGLASVAFKRIKAVCSETIAWEDPVFCTPATWAAAAEKGEATEVSNLGFQLFSFASSLQ